MSGKDLKQRLSIMTQALNRYATPPLVNSYVNAIRQVCSIGKVYVHKSQHKKFVELQMRLAEIDVEYDAYALSVVNAWWPWCKKQSMNSVPITIFCGIKAWDRFLHERDVFSADTKSEDLEYADLYNELTYAKVYIHYLLYEGVNHINDEAVHNATIYYRLSDRQQRPVTEALEIICSMYGMNQMDSYVDVACELRNRMQL